MRTSPRTPKHVIAVAHTNLLYVSVDGGYSTNAFAAQVAVGRHRTSANYLFADGHVEGMKWGQVVMRLTRPGSMFVRPDGQCTSP